MLSPTDRVFTCEGAAIGVIYALCRRSYASDMAQGKRARLITLRSSDRNRLSLYPITGVPFVTVLVFCKWRGELFLNVRLVLSFIQISFSAAM